MSGNSFIDPVATVIDPRDRPDVDRAGAGLYRTIHRDTIADVVDDLRERRVSAVLMSASRCSATDLADTIRVIKEFPRIPTVALLTRFTTTTASELVSLGNCGVRRLIDTRVPAGWLALRKALSTDLVNERDRIAMQRLIDDLSGAHDDTIRFCEQLFAGHAPPRTVRALAQSLGVLPSTLVSRFFRAELPAPKQYLVYAGLVRAARMLENPGLSIADVATHLDHSSPQSFCRHIRTYLKLSATEFREQYDGVRMLDHFRAELVRPHLARLRRLSPLAMRPRHMRTFSARLA